MRDAVEHTGSVFSHKVASMTGGRPRDPSAWSHGPEAGQDLMTWFREQRDELLEILEQRGPDAAS